MAKRSPKAPSVSLPEALDRARAIYMKEHRNAMTPDVVAQHMGYKGVSGTSLRMIASLRQYGVLEGRGDDVRLSEDVITVFADEEIGSQDRADALNRMLNNPPLFQEVMNDFPRTPSAPNLKAYMSKRKFSPNAAGRFADVYRESVEFVEDEISDYNGASDTRQEESNVNQRVIRDRLDIGSPMSSVTEKEGLTEIEYIRVSKNCGIRLIADGPYTKREIKTLAARIQAGVDAGVYDDDRDNASDDDLV